MSKTLIKSKVVVKGNPTPPTFTPKPAERTVATSSKAVPVLKPKVAVLTATDTSAKKEKVKVAESRPSTPEPEPEPESSFVFDINLTKKQNLLKYLKEQGHIVNNSCSVNSLKDKYYMHHPEVFHTLGFNNKTSTNLQDDEPVEGFEPKYDGGELCGPKEAPKEKKTPRMDLIEESVNKLVTRIVTHENTLRDLIGRLVAIEDILSGNSS